MRVLLIVNGSASSVTARARVVVQKAIASEHELTVAATSRRGHATRLAQGAAADGVDVVAVLGGDGTLNEAANGLAAPPPRPGTAWAAGTALAALPGGSTNVFARTVGWANDPIEATDQLIRSLRAGRIERVGVGEVNGRFFLFHVGIGFDAAVVAEVERRGGLKRYLGAAVFVVATVRTWRRGYDRSRPWFTVRSADGSLDIHDGYFAVVEKTDPYTFIGNRPVRLVPGTGLATALSLVAFRDLGLATLLPATVAAVCAGASPARPSPSPAWRRDPPRRRRPVVATEVDHLEVRGLRPVPYQVDGDFVGEADRLVLRYLPDALSLVVPEVATDRT